jgi:uncharacterized protein (DUF2267 family)
MNAVRATLSTLSERLTFEEAKDLAAQLPGEIAACLSISPVMHAQRLSLDEFFYRVATREKAHPPDAICHARVVMEVLSEAVTKGEMEDVLGQLPAEFRTFVRSGGA